MALAAEDMVEGGCCDERDRVVVVEGKEGRLVGLAMQRGSMGDRPESGFLMGHAREGPANGLEGWTLLNPEIGPCTWNPNPAQHRIARRVNRGWKNVR